MTEIHFSKKVIRECNREEIDYLKDTIAECMDGKQTFFLPLPASEEELKLYGDRQCEVTFLPINPNKFDRMVMVVPYFLKEENINVWYVTMKNEFGVIELNIKTPLREGHRRY